MAMMKTKKPLPSSIMLKDYLLDDLSSCSSNGFRSYPRKQCCATTVRFLLEIDLRNRESNGQRKKLLKTKPPPPPTKISAFQRASEAVINAVKLFRFSSPSKSKQIATKRSSILPRSLSRKLLKRSFWKRSKEMKIERLKSFQYYLDQKQQKPSVPPRSSTTVSTATAAAKIAAADSTSESNSHSNNSWSSSEFTSGYLQCSSDNSESSCGNDVVEGEKEVTGGKVGATVGGDSMEGATNSKQKSKRPKEEEKEQFSPVSVLDIPFGDDEEEEEEEEEEEVSSPFQSRLIRVEGTKQKLMQKLQRFESLAKLEPVALENRFSLSEYTDESLDHHQSAPKTLQEKEDETENKALDLLDQITSSIPSNSFKFLEDSLVLDFFKERVAEAESSTRTRDANKSFEQCVLIEANDWISGNPHELFLGWEVQKNRQVYLRDMEKGGRWRKNIDEHREEVAMELEVEVFASLVSEVFNDLVSS